MDEKQPSLPLRKDKESCQGRQDRTSGLYVGRTRHQRAVGRKSYPSMRIRKSFLERRVRHRLRYAVGARRVRLQRQPAADIKGLRRGQIYDNKAELEHGKQISLPLFRMARHRRFRSSRTYAARRRLQLNRKPDRRKSHRGQLPRT